MSWAHALIDLGLGYLALLWFLDFLRAHKHNKHRRLDSPSIHCERNPDWRHTAFGMFRRQGE